MTVLIWPCVVYHKILPKLYMKLEPHMMTLQYRISAKINATLNRKRGKQEAILAEKWYLSKYYNGIDNQLKTR